MSPGKNPNFSPASTAGRHKTIFLISLFLDHFLEIAWIAHAFVGIKAAAGILIVDAARRLFVRMPRKPLPLFLFFGALAASLAVNFMSLRLSSIALMLGAAAFSLAVCAFRRGGERSWRKP